MRRTRRRKELMFCLAVLAVATLGLPVIDIVAHRLGYPAFACSWLFERQGLQPGANVGPNYVRLVSQNGILALYCVFMAVRLRSTTD